MGFKIKYAEINKESFSRALGKVTATPGLPVKLAYNAGKIEKRILKEQVEGRKLFADLVNKHGKKDEAGNLIVDERGNYSISDDQKDEFDKQVDSMMAIEFEIPFFRLNMADLERVGLSGKELMALEPVLLSLEVLQGGGQDAMETESPNASA